MGSPYAQSGSSGGSVYAQTGASSGSPYAGAPAAPKHSGGGGILGAIKDAAHATAQSLDRSAHTVASIPAGTIDLVNKGVVQPWKDFVTTGHVSAKTNRTIDKTINEQSDAIQQTLSRPGHDPLATLMLVSPLLHGAGTVAGRGAAAAEAARAGEGLGGVAKAVAKTPEVKPRVLRSGQGETSLIPSRNAGVRGVQRVYDKALQSAIDTRPQGRVAAHAQKRIGGALDEEARVQQKMRAVPASLLDKAAGKLAKTPAARREQQAALELTSHQVTPDEAAAYHAGQAEKGVNPKQNQAVAGLYQRVGKRDLVHLDETRPAGEKVFINPSREALAKTDAALARVQKRGDRILVEKGVRSAEALQTRVDEPGQLRAGGAHYEKPTPGKLGLETPGLKRARQRVASLQGRIDRAQNADEIARDQGLKSGLELKGPMRFHARTPQQMAQLRGAVAVAKDDLARNERAAAKRVKPTGVVGGETARPGRGFVSDRISEKKMGKAEASASSGAVVGVARPPLTSHSYTGRAQELGLRPKRVTAAASRHFRAIVKFVNTDARRRAAYNVGTDVKRSPHDVLVRDPDGPMAKLDAPAIQQALGRERSAVDTADELATQEGLQAAHTMFLQQAIPGLADRFARDKQDAIGTPAPKGTRWVHVNALGELTRVPPAKSILPGRIADNINSSVTAMTVYFKVGHVGTRVLTNAATNIMQGSAIRQTKRSYQLWKDMSDEERARALGAAGQHGFSSLPHEGDTVVSRVAGAGAQWWAKHADAMFRFNSLAYELRQVGYKTPEEFTKALDGLESGGQGLPAHEWSKLSAAARRADREAISYDRLNDFERRYVTRGLWFYPWIKGSTLFTVRSILEHPFKAGALGLAGEHGRQVQEGTLGPVPSYEQGLLALGGGPRPLTTNLSTFSPLASAGDVIGSVGRPGGLAGFFNPALGAAGQFAYGLNQYGGSSKSPYLDALLALGAATPEQQMAEAYASRGSDQSTRMFPKSTLGTLERFLGGPATPRRVNKAALAKAAARERSGRR